MSGGQELVHFEAARSALALARSVDEVKSIRDTAVAVAAYARQAKDGTLIADATEIRARAERRLGELIAERRDSGGLHPGGRPSKPGPADHPVSLSKSGIDKRLADRARKAAAMPPPAFEAALAEKRALAVAVSEGDRALIGAARERQQAAKLARREQRERELGNRIRTLPEKRFGVIYADPPWRWQAWSEQDGFGPGGGQPLSDDGNRRDQGPCRSPASRPTTRCCGCGRRHRCCPRHSRSCRRGASPIAAIWCG